MPNPTQGRQKLHTLANELESASTQFTDDQSVKRVAPILDRVETELKTFRSEYGIPGSYGTGKQADMHGNT